MKTNCAHFPEADDICFVCPIIFDWKIHHQIPHTYSATIGGFVVGRYDQPSDGSTWISITGPAGKPCPYTPKKFPDRIGAELWAADTLRLLSVAPKQETSMTPDLNESDNPKGEPLLPNEPTGPAPGQPANPGEPLRPTDPDSEPQDCPGDFVDDEPGEDDDEDDLDDESTGFEDADEESDD